MKHTKAVQEISFLEKAHGSLVNEYKLLERVFLFSASEHNAKTRRLSQENKRLQQMLDCALVLQENTISIKVT